MQNMYKASITSATIVSGYNNKKGYTNNKSNNADTQDYINAKWYYQ